MESCLRAWMQEDAPALAKAFNNPKIHANLRDGPPCPYTAADAEEYIHGVLEAPPGSQYVWAVVVNGVVGGCVGIFRKENIHCRTAEMGYYVAEEYWGKGIMTTAVKEACRRAFGESDLLRIFAEPFSHNKASRRVLEKAGFTHEGTMRKNAVKNGEIIDMELYALIR